jgi:hypothetical protein
MFDLSPWLPSVVDRESIAMDAREAITTTGLTHVNLVLASLTPKYGGDRIQSPPAWGELGGGA